jgi:TonB family protein
MSACRIAGTGLLLCVSAGRIAAQNPGAPGTDGVYAVGDGVSAPALIAKIDPEYPETARNLRAHGVVRLSAVVEPDGTASDFRVTKPLGYGLEDKAIEAVRKLRYQPGMKNGSPVRVRAVFEVRFPPIPNPVPDRWFSGLMEFSTEAGLTPPVVTSGTMPKPDGKLDYEHLVLAFTVDASGTVMRVHMVSGEPASARTLTGYLTKWKFLPAMKEGQPVEATGTVRFSRGSDDTQGTNIPAGLPEKTYVNGEGVSKPKLLKKVDPDYPEALRASKIQGTVLLGIVVDEAGRVVNAEVLKSLDPLLDQKAIESVMRWKLDPARKDGNPVRFKATVEINFKLL